MVVAVVAVVAVAVVSVTLVVFKSDKRHIYNYGHLYLVCIVWCCVIKMSGSGGTFMRIMGTKNLSNAILVKP